MRTWPPTSGVWPFNDHPVLALTLRLPWEGLPPVWRYPIDFMVESEGLEPAGDLSRISNLLIPLELLSPALPLDPRIWHWADATPSRYSCNRHVEADLAFTDCCNSFPQSALNCDAALWPRSRGRRGPRRQRSSRAM
jgi:hypothetical protein